MSAFLLSETEAETDMCESFLQPFKALTRVLDMPSSPGEPQLPTSLPGLSLPSSHLLIHSLAFQPQMAKAGCSHSSWPTRMVPTNLATAVLGPEVISPAFRLVLRPEGRTSYLLRANPMLAFIPPSLQAQSCVSVLSVVLAIPLLLPALGLRS